MEEAERNFDVLIVGCGVAGLCCALNLPRDMRILMLTKSDAEESDSFLAQGGMCMLRGKEDFDGYFEDTMRAGHYENNEAAVSQMLWESQAMAQELVENGVEFARDEQGNFRFTREGGHGRPRILFHDDITGKEITSKLLANVRKLNNVIIREHCELLDLICKDATCYGGVLRDEATGELGTVYAKFTLLATGGVGGLYENSTNFRHLTGDALAIALRHGIEVEHLDYVQIHPTTFYVEHKEDRRFLISESVRGEGAVLLDKNGKRFCNELMPRDIVTGEIRVQMKKDGTKHVWLDMRPIGEKTIKEHFPTIRERCLQEGYDVLTQPIPVVPAQHYFMGGIRVDLDAQTNFENLYAAGETACNGVHGKNRLASNSLLESLIWAKRAAIKMTQKAGDVCVKTPSVDLQPYADYNRLKEEYKEMVRVETEREACCD